MREVPKRIGRLPEQYFTALLARVAAAAARGGEPLVDLGRGNPEIGPPAHVVHALTECAERHDVHGYAPVAGLPGTKTGLMEFALCAVEDGGTIVLPDPGYPDYFSAVALAGAKDMPFSGFDVAADAMYLNFPSNPT